MTKKGDKEVLRAYLQWMRLGAAGFYLLAIVLAFCKQKGLLFAWSFLFLGLASYILYQAEKMSKNKEALTRLARGVKKDLLVYSGLFALLWLGLIFYLYQG
ncbi:hypothetical protein HMPREF1633_13230 [Tissierellia bacterium S5-A11]|nr:hypothetical protein HMPREF1633_13230 [Tissierellia bacterium S5-A11]